MKRILVFVTIATVAAIAAATYPQLEQIAGRATPNAGQGTTESLTVIRVLDGDTITTRSSAGAQVRVRMLGIDAPEIAHNGNPADCGGDAATTALTSLLKGKRITATTDPRSDSHDKYGRLLAYISDGTTDIAKAMLEKGMAEAWYPASAPEPTRFAAYSATEATARATRTGLWANCSTVGR